MALTRLHELCSVLEQLLAQFELCISVYLGLDNECPVTSNGNLLFHHAEVVEPADKEPGAVQPQGEVHIVTSEAVLVVLDVLTPVNIEKEEVMNVTSGERLPLFDT